MANVVRNASFLSELVDGIAKHIRATVPFTPYHWDDSGAAYPSGVLGIYRDKTPEIVYPTVTIAVYESVQGADSLVSVQFKVCSKDPHEGDAIDADLRACFDHLYAKTLGTVKVAYAERTSGTLLPQDTQGRGVRTENYQFRVDWPNLNRPI